MREVLACERRAWEWARDNALIWTPTMEREAEAGIASYEAHLVLACERAGVGMGARQRADLDAHDGTGGRGGNSVLRGALRRRNERLLL